MGICICLCGHVQMFVQVEVRSQHCLSVIAQLSLFLETVYDYVALSWSGIQYTNQTDLDLRD